MKAIEERLISIDFEHAIWLNELIYYFKEIALYEKLINKLIKAYSRLSEEVELGIILLNFLKLREETEEIREQIRKHMLHVQQKIHSNGELKAIVDSVHQKSREDMENLRKNMAVNKEKVHQLMH